jgi:lysophospholipase L1-like esterase
MNPEPTNIICFGDSITEAAEFAPEQRWPALLQAKLDDWVSGHFTVYNRGVGGDTTARAFDRLESDVLPLLPGVLLVQFGFNDANVRDWAVVPRVGLDEFRRNLREFHRVAIARGGECAFIVNHTIARVAGGQGNSRSYNDNFGPYNAAIHEVARTCAAPMIDLPALLTQQRVVLDHLLAEDGMHLSISGNGIYADLVFAVLRQMLAQAGDDTRMFGPRAQKQR